MRTFSEWVRDSVLDRPLVGDHHLPAWVVLLAALPNGLDSYWDTPYIGLVHWTPRSAMGVNYYVYHVAAEAALAGQNIYTAHPPGEPTYTYLYPPGTVLAWLPFTVFGWQTGFALITGITVLSAVLGTLLVLAYVEGLGPSLGLLDAGLVFGAFLFSKAAFGNVYYGNINVMLGLLFALGFWALQTDRDRTAGASFGLAALFKVFPAIIGLWLLRTRRWKATGAAIATGLAGILLGVLAFGVDTTRYYVTEVVRGRTDAEAFVGGYPADGFLYVSIQRPLSHVVWTLWPEAPYAVLPALAVVLASLTLYVFYVDLSGPPERLMAMLATTVVAMILVPSLQWYAILVFLPMIALAYVWQEGPGRYAYLFGVVVFWQNQHPGDHQRYLANWLGWLPEPIYGVGHAFVATITLQSLGFVVMLAGCAWYKLRTVEDIRVFDPREQARALVAWAPGV